MGVPVYAPTLFSTWTPTASPCKGYLYTRLCGSRRAHIVVDLPGFWRRGTSTMCHPSLVQVLTLSTVSPSHWPLHTVRAIKTPHTIKHIDRRSCDRSVSLVSINLFKFRCNKIITVETQVSAKRVYCFHNLNPFCYMEIHADR